MAEEPQVIHEQMEETRTALADKLGQLTDKITGTVETVQETVDNITGTVESVEKTVERTVESVADTVESVGESAQETVHAVQEAFNIPKQFEQHPWLFFGGSVLLGFLGGKWLTSPQQQRHGGNVSSSRVADHMADFMAQSSAATSQRPADYTSQASEGWNRGMGGSESTNGHGSTAAAESTSWFGGLVEKFMPDLNKLKELALGTMFATARDLVTQNMPQSLKTDIVNLFNDVATHAGGKPIQGTILEEGHEQNSGHNQERNSGQKEVMR